MSHSSTHHISEIKKIIRKLTDGHHLGVFTCVDPFGRPHASWMGTVYAADYQTIVSISSPDSRKIKYIEQNPQVEWMVSDEQIHHVVYFKGLARLMEEASEIKRTWNEIPDKSRSYFLRFQERGVGFKIIETKVKTVEYRVPTENVFVEVAVSDLA